MDSAKKRLLLRKAFLMREKLMEIVGRVKSRYGCFSSPYSAWLHSYFQEAPEASLQYVTIVIKQWKKLLRCDSGKLNSLYLTIELRIFHFYLSSSRNLWPCSHFLGITHASEAILVWNLVLVSSLHTLSSQSHWCVWIWTCENILAEIR